MATQVGALGIAAVMGFALGYFVLGVILFGPGGRKGGPR